MRYALIALAVALIGSSSVSSGATLAQMRWHHRVLLLFAPDAQATALVRQREVMAAWGRPAAERDLVAVTVIGGAVSGASDEAAALRRRFKPASSGFTAILIGKDGGEKLRSAAPLTAERMEATIDAMPMRRNGER